MPPGPFTLFECLVYMYTVFFQHVKCKVCTTSPYCLPKHTCFYFSVCGKHMLPDSLRRVFSNISERFIFCLFQHLFLSLDLKHGVRPLGNPHWDLLILLAIFRGTRTITNLLLAFHPFGKQVVVRMPFCMVHQIPSKSLLT